MNDARIKALKRQRYSEVSERQRERNKERVDHVSSILSELEEEVGDDNGRLRTARELLSLAGTETRTKGCNTILTGCLKLLRESAEDAGLGEQYQEQMRRMPDETASDLSPKPYQELYERDRWRQERW